MRWAGVRWASFEALRAALAPVGTAAGDAWNRTEDEGTFRAAAGAARLPPSGGAHWLL